MLLKITQTKNIFITLMLKAEFPKWAMSTSWSLGRLGYQGQLLVRGLKVNW